MPKQSSMPRLAAAAAMLEALLGLGLGLGARLGEGSGLRAGTPREDIVEVRDPAVRG